MFICYLLYILYSCFVLVAWMVSIAFNWMRSCCMRFCCLNCLNAFECEVCFSCLFSIASIASYCFNVLEFHVIPELLVLIFFFLWCVNGEDGSAHQCRDVLTLNNLWLFLLNHLWVWYTLSNVDVWVVQYRYMVCSNNDGESLTQIHIWFVISGPE